MYYDKLKYFILMITTIILFKKIESVDMHKNILTHITTVVKNIKPVLLIFSNNVVKKYLSFLSIFFFFLRGKLYRYESTNF